MKNLRRLAPRFARDATRLLRKYSLRELMNAEFVSFGQFGEDIVLEHLFHGQPTGFYVDVGAFDPIRYSNTYLFYRKGWSGLNVEPAPAALRRFERLRPRDINLNLAVAATEGESDFTLDDLYSRLPGAAHLARDARAGLGRVRVRTCPLATILDRHLPAGTAIDFLSVDCEGSDEIVLASNDWDRYRPRVVLAEDFGESGTLERFMAGKGYSFLLRLEYTRIFLEQKSFP